MPVVVAILTAVSFTVALGFGIVAPDIPAFAQSLRGQHRLGRRRGQCVRPAAGGRGPCPPDAWWDRFGEHKVMAIVSP